MKFDLTSTGSEAVRAKLRQLGQHLTRQALTATAEDVEQYVSTEAGKHTKPGGTGALFRSVYANPLGDDAWEIGHDRQVAPHAVFVHWGTRPHIIRPKNKKMLRWAGPSGFIFAREVHHPGYKGDPWMVRAAAEAPRIFEQHVNARIAQTMGT